MADECVAGKGGEKASAVAKKLLVFLSEPWNHRIIRDCTLIKNLVAFSSPSDFDTIVLLNVHVFDCGNKERGKKQRKWGGEVSAVLKNA